MNKPSSPAPEVSKTLSAPKSPSTEAVTSVTSQLNTSSVSFLQNQNTLMMNMYTNYFNQYLQQYQQHQQQVQALTTKSRQDEASAESDMEMLQQQAAYYGQQQRSIQAQLENTLSQSAQQLVQEITAMAASKLNQPFVLNQFSHQQQHHIHQHHHGFGSIPPPPSSALPQSIIPQGLISNPSQPQQPPPNLYNMHYNYNMIVS